ncbi:MAG TPA: hypothetical protein VK550_06670 [Polyangiaceae bacterium]|nr:hypothetical protein [Polyangiaceae bacterium]
MTPEPPDVEMLLGAYPPADPKAALRQIAERLAEFFASTLPTLLHVVAHPDLGAGRLRKWHAQLPFVPIVRALGERLRRMGADGLVARVDADAAAHTLVGAVHSIAFLETMMNTHGQRHHASAKVGAVFEIVWSGLAPSTERKPKPKRRAPRSKRRSG